MRAAGPSVIDTECSAPKAKGSRGERHRDSATASGRQSGGATSAPGKIGQIRNDAADANGRALGVLECHFLY